MIPPAVDKLRAYAEANGAKTYVAESSGTLPSVRRKVDGEFVDHKDVPLTVCLLWVYTAHGCGYFAWGLLGLPGERWTSRGGNWRSATFMGLCGVTRFKQLIIGE